MRAAERHLRKGSGLKHEEGKDVGAREDAAALEQRALPLREVRPVDGAVDVRAELRHQRLQVVLVLLSLEAVQMALQRMLASQMLVSIAVALTVAVAGAAVAK